MPFPEVKLILITAILSIVAIVQPGYGQERPQVKVTVPDNGQISTPEENKPLTAVISSFTSRTRKNSFVPSMIKTAPVQGGVKSDIVKPKVYQNWLKKTHPQFALNVSKYSEDTVVVVKGQWDNSAKTLKKLRVNHKRVSAKEFNKLSLKDTKVVIIDCEGGLDRLGKQKLRTFVIRGGYLLSTDWDLDGFLSSTFMNYVVWNKATNRKLIYDATVIDADPVLFKNTVTNAPWKLDQESHLIRIMNPKKVRLLIVSRKLQKEDPDRLGALAIAFPFGRGYVLHMAGHFDNNSGIPIRHRLPDPAPVIQLSLRQALAINFLVAGVENRKIPF